MAQHSANCLEEGLPWTKCNLLKDEAGWVEDTRADECIPRFDLSDVEEEDVEDEDDLEQTSVLVRMEADRPGDTLICAAPPPPQRPYDDDDELLFGSGNLGPTPEDLELWEQPRRRTRSRR
jgi:hypothetical protein